MTGYVLLLVIQCCGPAAVVTDIQYKPTALACDSAGAIWMKAQPGNSFLCLQRKFW